MRCNFPANVTTFNETTDGYARISNATPLLFFLIDAIVYSYRNLDVG